MFRYFRKEQRPRQSAALRNGRKPLFSSHSRDGCSPRHVALNFETLEPRWLLDGTMLQISEFMADNTKTLADGDGKYSDWIEVYNPNTYAVSLAGWHLTDNANKPTKWPFPDVTLAAGGYLVVFASGESTANYVDAKGYYHTNFKSDKEGEYLGLYRPDGTVACEYAPQFPQQISDASYGIGVQTTTTSLIAAGASAKVLVPTTTNGGSTLGSTWQGAAANEPFSDSSWTSGTTGIGYTTTTTPVASSNLILRLNADSSSALVTDTSGTGHNGTNVNSSVSYVDFMADTSTEPLLRRGLMELKASENDLITVASNSAFYSTTSGTISFWMKSSGTVTSSGTEGAVLFDLRSSRGLSILQTDAGYIRVYAYKQSTSTPVNTITSSTTVSDNQWHLITVNFTQTTGGACSLYIDGVLNNQANNTAAWDWTQNQPMAIGQSQSGSDAKNWRKYNGLLDDYRFYNTVLTAAQITSIYKGADEAVTSSDVSLNVQSQMYNVNTSAFIRIPFTVSDPNAFTSLVLRVQNNDGFVAWINGVQVASENAPTSVAWNSAATDVHSPGRSHVVTITVTSGMLRTGTNILAIQGLNNSLTDPNFLIIPTLDGITVNGSAKMYFVTPTPGAANSAGKTDIGPFITDATNAVERPVAGATTPLTITAHVTPSLHAVASVQLAWRIMFNSETLVTMYDDGPSGGHGDALAGDLTYTALIYPNVIGLGAGQMLRWRIIATDTSAIQSTGPFYLPVDSTNSQYYDQYYGTVALDSVSTQLPMMYFFVNGYTTPTSTSNETTVDTDAGARGDFFYNNELYDNVLISIKGYTTRYLLKRSHRIDFNDDHQFLLEDGTERRGSIALNAEYVDPSYIRQYLSMWLFAESGTPCPVDFPVRMQMNGDFWQLAFVTEPLGKSLLKRLGIDPDDSMYSMVGQFSTSYYGSMAKETRQWDTSWADYNTVAAAIASTNTVAQLRQSLFDYFDVPEVINYIAMARLTQQNDDVWANMAIYCNTDGDGLWRVMPYDLNLSFGQLYYGDDTATNTTVIGANDNAKSHPLYGSSSCLYYKASGTTNGNYNRLYNAIIQVPETREMLLRRERTLMDEFLQAPGTPYAQRVIETKIDAVVAQITQEANMDRTKWGWPPVSGPYGLGNVAFSQAISDIKNLFLDPARTHLYVTHSVDNTSKTIGIGNANNAGIPHAQTAGVLINISEVDAVPISGDQDEEYIKLTNPNSSAVDISGWTLTGGITFTLRQGTVIPAGGSLYVSPNTKAFRSRATSPTGGQSLFSVGPYDGHLTALGETLELRNTSGTLVSSYTVPNTASPAQTYLRITEINYHPVDPVTGSSYTQDDFEFIELYNTSSTVTIDLTAVHFSRDLTDGTGIDFDFTTSGVTSLAPGQYIVVAKNPTALATRYNLTGVTVVGPYTWVLSNSEDTVRLFDAVNEKIDEIHYQDTYPWPSRADGKGFTLEIINPLGSDNDPTNWRASVEYQGTPGHAGIGSTSGVVINEVLTHDDYPLYDAIELYNTTSSPVNIGGWYLSDTSDDLKRYRIPDGTVLAAHEYVVFSEEQFGVSVFSGDTQPGDGDAQAQDSGATLYLSDSTWRKIALPYTVTASTVLEFDYMSTRQGNIQGIGLEEDNIASSNRLFQLYGTTSWGISNYANYSGSTWKHYVIPVGTFYTGAMNYLVLANGDSADQATSYFKNVKVYEGSSGTALNFDKYFGLSSTGDDVWLMQTDSSGNLTCFADHAEFWAAINGESFGRWPNGTGVFYPMLNRTFGQANDTGGNGPRIGPLLISEVMYHPAVGEDENADNFEYIEIFNPTATAVDLSNWQLSGGVDFTFASGTTIAAKSTLLVLPFDPSDPLNGVKLASFKSKYGIGSSLTLIGGFSSHLANEGETVDLLNADGVLEDEIIYSDASPWPTAADGGGSSLQRVSTAAWGDDSASWLAAAPTPGSAMMIASTVDWSGAGLTLKINTSDGLVHLYQTGTTTDAATPRALASITSVDIAGRDGIDDVLTVDFANGNPIPAGGLIFNGGSLGSGSGNSLVVIGSSAGDSVTLSASQILLAGANPIAYSNTTFFSFLLGSGDDLLVNDNATLKIKANNAISAGTSVTIDGGALDLNGKTDSVGSLLLKSGSVVNGTLYAGSYTIESGTATANIVGPGGLQKTTSAEATTGAISAPSITVSAGELTASSIITGTLTLGAGTTLTIAAIPGGPSAGSGLTPLSARSLHPVTTKAVSQSVVAEAVTECSSTIENAVVTESQSVVESATADAVVESSPLAEDATQKLSVAVSTARATLPVECIAMSETVDMAVSRPLVQSPTDSKVDSPASPVIVEGRSQCVLVWNHAVETNNTVFTSLPDELRLDVGMTGRRAASASAIDNWLAHSVALRTMASYQHRTRPDAEVVSDIARHAHGGRHAAQFDRAVDGLLDDEDAISIEL
jgi:hypothetical protein